MPGTFSSVLSMDSYYKDLSYLVPCERSKKNFDNPDAFDYDLLIKHLKKIVSGNTIEIPQYNYATHTRCGYKVINGSDTNIILVEGIYTLYWEEIRNLLSLKIFIELTKNICLSRRISRDSKERERSQKSINEQFCKTVWPMYIKHIAPTKNYADLVLRGDSSIEYLERIIVHNLINTA